MNHFGFFSFVSSLLRHCCPTAISRLVISVVVWPTINRQTFRTFTHILKEILKRIPSLAHHYAAPSVMVVILVIFLGASFHHSIPNSPCPRIGMAVFESRRIQDFLSSASTGRGFSTSYGLDSYIENRPTRAFTGNHSSFSSCAICGIMIWRVRNDFKSSKLASDDVFCGRHGIGSFNVMFSDGRPAVTGAHCEIIKRYGFEINNKRNS